MSRCFVAGTKKLFSLAKTKIRLAEDSDTFETKPAPLPLIKKISGEEIKTVEEAKKYLEERREKIDYSNRRELAENILMILDVIEGVKYRFEPPEYQILLSKKELMILEGQEITILMLSSAKTGGVDLFLGEDPPEGVLHLGRVVSNIAPFLDYAFTSTHFSEGLRLRNICVRVGRKTLIAYAVKEALCEFGASER